MRIWLWIGLAAIVLQGCSPTEYQGELPAVVDYNFHVRPILSNSCYVCHGPDVSTREAGLRLDLRSAATAKRGGGGRAIAPGRPGRSLLVERISSEDPDFRMPPPEMNTVLTPREIALLRKWINQGAEYKEHWAFLPLQTPPAPEVDIDHFVDQRLEEAGLEPASPATPEAFLRRASYVLTGLPPTPNQVKAFAEEASHEQAVDNLLNSPRFGERWARHWMDLVRYAESKGHEFDYNIDNAWVYRDYLIRAFNEDVPYDQFVQEHLAGDLLSSPRKNLAEGYNESVIGTSYFYLGEGKHSPVDTRIDEAERFENIIDVTSKSFLGLTVACARCHDHKFDPIPTTDYYAMYGMVESSRYAAIPLLSSHYTAQLDTLVRLEEELRASIGQTWRRQLANNLPVVPAANRRQKPADTSRYPLRNDVQILGDFRGGGFDGWFPHGPTLETGSGSGSPVVRRGILDSLTSGYVTSRQPIDGLPAALRSPTFTIEHDSLLVMAAGYEATIRVVIDNLRLIQNPIHGEVIRTIESDQLEPYRFDLTLWSGRKAYVEFVAGTFLSGDHITEMHQLNRDDSSYFDVAYAALYNEGVALLPPRGAEDADLATSVDAWTAGTASVSQVNAINDALRAGLLIRPNVRAYAATTEEYKARLGGVVDFVGLVDGDTVSSPVFDRGDVRNLKGDPVPHRFLTALDLSLTPFRESASGRLDFAQAIVDPENPLTARVMVNRLWHHAFGTGIVSTVDNFGAQGALPTHPGLLDYLAQRFIDLGYSVKGMLREIVLSDAFRRQTGSIAADPNNRLISHYPVRRLEAESIRDAILAASGSLDTTMYGPPVPAYLTEFMEGRGKPPVSGPLDGEGRRSVYLAVRRNFLSPMMLAFDMPIPFSTFGARNTSNVPSQSLTMLNDPFVADQARQWGQRLAGMHDLDLNARIEYIYLTAMSRHPEAAELARAQRFIEQEVARLGLELEEGLQHEEIWAAYCHIVFNLKEFIYLI